MMSERIQPKDDGNILSVSEYTGRLKRLVKDNIHDSWIRGEISNFKKQANGHVYFTLKDEKSQISVVLFRTNGERFSQLKDGMHVIVFGEISVYEIRGQFQIICKHVLDIGQGALQKKFEELKACLSKDGIFDVSRKKSIPNLPKKIAVITSATGSVIRDFVEILKRRHWVGTIHVFHCQVQGQNAHMSIIKQIDLVEKIQNLIKISQKNNSKTKLENEYDLLILMRGGGSFEDLWCFNEESLVRRLHACKLPTISAIGHQTDYVLTDFAADLRAETPSAAAELISSKYIQLNENTKTVKQRIERIVSYRMEFELKNLSILNSKMDKNSPEIAIKNNFFNIKNANDKISSVLNQFFNRKKIDVQNLFERLCSVPLKKQIERNFFSLKQSISQMNFYTETILKKQRIAKTSIENSLENLQFRSTLKRGFCAIQDFDGKWISSSHELLEMQRVNVILQDGKIQTFVEKIESK